jgi:hypothetical protein
MVIDKRPHPMDGVDAPHDGGRMARHCEGSSIRLDLPSGASTDARQPLDAHRPGGLVVNHRQYLARPGVRVDMPRGLRPPYRADILCLTTVGAVSVTTILGPQDQHDCRLRVTMRNALNSV